MSTPITPGPMITHCSSCSASVMWVKTRKGKAMMVNADPSPNGNLALTEWTIPESGEKVLLAENLTRGQAGGMRAAGRPTYNSHFASCPKANEHRRR